MNSKVTLYIYNYSITKIASFNKNLHDCHKCMEYLNKELVDSYNGILPDKIFHFITYMSKGQLKIIVSYKGANLGNDFYQYVNKVRLHMEVLQMPNVSTIN